MQGIEIPIGAPLGQLDKDLKNASTQISNFATTTLGKFAVINNAKFTFGQNFVKEADRLAGKGKSLGDNLSGPLVKGSNQAAFALQNLGRVAQDAPFGFIGIQNNLNPLLESFQRLKSETGSTSGALKALGSSLIGPAGLGIALSVVSAAVLFYQQYQQRANKTTNEAKKETDDYVNSLNQVDQAMVKGAQNAQTELITLKLLYKQYQNSTLPLEQRKDAYKEIQKLYPSYFGNLKFERDATEKTKDAYDKLSSSIIATARARAGIDIITKNSKIQLEIESQQISNQTEINKILASNAVLTKRAAASQGAIGAAGIGAAGNEGVYRAIARNESKINDLNLIKEELNGRNNALKNKNLEIERLITGEIEKGAKLTGDIGGKGVSSKTAKDVKTVADVLAKLELELRKVDNQVDGTFGSAKKDKVKAFRDAIDGLTEVGAGKGIIKGIQNRLLDTKDVEVTAKTVGVKTATAFAGGFAAAATTIKAVTFKPKFDLLNRELMAFNDSLSQIISGSLTETLGGIGTAIGTAIANGTSIAGALGQTLLSSLGSVLGQLGQMAIATGVAILGIKLSLKSLNPVAAIAGGVALLALAGYVKGRASKMGGGMGGGSAGGGGNLSAPTPQSSAAISTSAAGSSQDFAGGRVVFEISGTNLIGVLNRAGAKLTRFG